MDQDTIMLITVWVMTGSFLGGVVTPALVADKKVNDWMIMLIGLAVGTVGNLILLVPLWVLLYTRSGEQDDTRPAWQYDVVSADEALRQLAEQGEPREQFESMGATLKANFWPKSRPADEHSHRMTYVGVFFALAVITIIEVFISVWDDPGFDIVGPLVALSSAKVILVVMYFMHLRYDHKWYSWIFAFSLPFAGIVLVVLAASQ